MRHAATLLAFLGVAATADAQEIRGIYAGLSVGYFGYEEGGENLGVRISENTSAYRALVGYQFNSVYGIELAAGRTGTFTERFSGVSPTVGEVSLEISGEYEVSTLRFVAFAPFSSLGMFGGAGYYDATLDASARFTSTGEVTTSFAEDTDDGLTVFGGVQFEFDRIAVRGEYEWFDTDDGVDAQSINVTGLFRF